MPKKPDEHRHPDKLEPFGDLLKSVHQFFQERPVKGVLQSIDDFFKQPFPHASFPVDIRDAGDKQIITAALPGVKKEQISLNILGNSLTISVQNQDILTEEDDQKKTFRRFGSYQSASRMVTLPHSIDEKQVKASYRDGLLEITIPKIQGKKIDLID
ncbi:Hsp20/alpha crystallin family protein [Mesobacillus foraminis]|uniref:Hsp20/alpha crystallin family protein n=1 Tax=Mesobacillus foraminis TaxID=279826 RepID=UPI0039A09AB1